MLKSSSECDRMFITGCSRKAKVKCSSDVVLHLKSTLVSLSSNNLYFIFHLSALQMYFIFHLSAL